MKASAVRRKTKAQKQQEMLEEERKQQEIAEKLAEYDQFKVDSAKKQQAIIDEKENYRQLCSQLIDEGIIKQIDDGQFVSVDDPNERQSIQTESKRKKQLQMADQSQPGHQPEFDQQILNDGETHMNDLQ